MMYPRHIFFFFYRFIHVSNPFLSLSCNKPWCKAWIITHFEKENIETKETLTPALLFWVCLGLSLLSNSLWLSRMTSSYLSSNSYCNSLLARITKQFNGSDVWFIVATSLATEKISVATQLATQLHESRYKSNGLKFYWAISYFSVYWEIAKPYYFEWLYMSPVSTLMSWWSHPFKCQDILN
jgi:hypothetical protein